MALNRNRSLILHINADYFKYSLYDLLVVLYFAHNLLPAFGYYMPSLIYLGLFAVLMLMSISLNKKDLNALIPILLVSALECLDCIVGVKQTSIAITLYGELQSLLFMMIVFKYAYHNRKMEMQRLFNLIIGMYVITAVTTIIGWIANPEASRLLALGTGTEMYSIYTAQNLGGFDFVYEMVLLAPLFIGMTKKNIINKITGIVLIVLSGVVAVNSQYSTAILLYLLTLIVLLCVDVTPRKLVIIGVFGVIGVFVMSSVLSALFFALAKSIDSGIVAERINYVAEVLAGNQGAESLAVEARLATYEKPLTAFLETFGFGKWSGAGSAGHSFVFDNLGSYGYVGFFAIICFLKGIYNISMRPYKGMDCYGYMLWSYLLAIFMMVLNPKTNIFFLGVELMLFGNVMMKREDNYEISMGS